MSVPEGINPSWRTETLTTTAHRQVSQCYTVSAPVVELTANLLTTSAFGRANSLLETVQVAFSAIFPALSESNDTQMHSLLEYLIMKPQQKQWAMSPTIYNVQMMYVPPTARKALLCRLLAERSMYRRHDYLAMLESTFLWYYSPVSRQGIFRCFSQSPTEYWNRSFSPPDAQVHCPVGGGIPIPTRAFSLNDLAVYNTFSKSDVAQQFDHADMFEFLILLPKPQGLVLLSTDGDCLGVDAPLDLPLSCMQVASLKAFAVRHCLVLGRDHRTRETIAPFLKESLGGTEFLSVFCKLPRYAPIKQRQAPRPQVQSSPVVSPSEKLNKTVNHRECLPEVPEFPPAPLTRSQQETIVSNFCAEINPHQVEEFGCAVCGQLTPLKDLSKLERFNLSCLHSPNLTRKERKSESDPVEGLDGPVLANNCSGVCPTCHLSISQARLPTHSLANGLWLGEVPHQLANLTFAEKMLVARIRHNSCLVHVSSGRAKMVANVIMYSLPTVKVYHALPPPKDEMEDVFAFVFIGYKEPTADDIKRMPMLVRRDRVAAALEWLKLNHIDYSDLCISQDNLETYPLNGVPVTMDFRKVDESIDPTDKEALSMSKHEADLDVEQGTSEGPCPLVVRGLTGPEYEKLSIKAMKAKALQHLQSGGKMLAVGHASTPQSMYHNPQAYPQMFPWLFPYGLGGIGQSRHSKTISEREYKKRLLMYYDKRFQLDYYFPMIAFNQEQIKANVTGSFIYSKRSKFENISSRIAHLDQAVLASVADRLSKGEYIKPESEVEKNCFSLLEDIDHVGAYSDGFLTSKKYMRNEIWSLISHKGAPNWFITFSPADNKHPLCLYYADKQIKFTPDLKSLRDRDLLVLNNPVAAARFFDVLVRLVIKHVFGFESGTRGVYGKPSAYYGTVEQQGRLTLHLHMML